MTRTVIFGNSGSGKSTYAKALAARQACPHMDLDTVAWLPNAPTPTRQALDISSQQIHRFMDSAQDWVIEGCYADLLAIALPHATELVFLNPGTDTCIANAKNRPWEPHKYSSPEAQDADLDMLIAWIRDYDQRTDEFSYTAHRQLYEQYSGDKHEYTSNQRPE